MTRTAVKSKSSPIVSKARGSTKAADASLPRKTRPAVLADDRPGPDKKKAATGRRRADVSGDATSIRDQVVAFKREQVILAAVDLFFANGYQQTTLEEVARQLNVTKPFIYYHFRDKEDLLYEISLRAVQHANETLVIAIDRSGTPAQRLHWAMKTLMMSIIQQQRYTAVFFREQKNLSEASREPIYAVHHEYDKLLVTLLNEGIRTGDFVVDDAHICALGLSGMTGWSYNWYRPNGRLSAEEISELVANMALRAVGVNPSVGGVQPAV